jgi:5-formyltetrahydrofolate cyclo-ligase
MPDRTIDTAVTKPALRASLRAHRRARPAAERADAARALAGYAPLLARPLVAAFIGVGDEPATRSLVDALVAQGTRVLLPLLEPDLDLDWAVYDGRLVQRARGLQEPVGVPLGRDRIADADLVLVPALAVDTAGRRLGQGGGSYDRALRRATGVVYAVVFDDELVAVVPVEPHDLAVDGVVTPTGGVTRFGNTTTPTRVDNRELP